MSKLKSGDVFAINLNPYYNRYAYCEYVIIKNIPKGNTGSEVLLVFNYFTNYLIQNVFDLELNEIFIGPLIVNIPSSKIDNFIFIGKRKHPTVIDRLPYFKNCEFFFDFKNPYFIPNEWWLKDYHVSETELDLNLYPKDIKFENLEFSTRIGPDFIRQLILIEYSKYSGKELILNEEDYNNFQYMIRKSKYFPSRQINQLKEKLFNAIKYNNFLEHKIDSEIKENNSLDISKIDDFWDWLKKYEAKLFEQNGNDLNNIIEIITHQFSKINSAATIFVEINKNKLVLTVSAQGLKNLIPDVVEIVKRAPVFEHVKVVAFKQANHDLKEFSFENAFSYKLDDFYFTYSESDGQFNLDIYIGGIEELSEDDIQVAFIFLDSQLGEFKVISLINEINFHVLTDTINKIKFTKLDHYIK